MPTFLVPLPPSAPRNQVTPRPSLILHRRKCQSVLSNPLHPPELPDPPDLTITPQSPPSSSVNTSPPPSTSLFCTPPSSISVQPPSSLPSPFWLRLSLHNKVSKLVLVKRRLTDSWEAANASMHNNLQPPPFVELDQPDLHLSHPYKRWLSLMVSFPHRKRRAPPPAVRSQELEHQLELWMLDVLKPPSLQDTTFQSLEDWILDVDTLVVECFVATVLLNHCSSNALWLACTGDSTSLSCSSCDSSFTEISRKFTGYCLASVYRVHIAPSRDVVLDFASLFYQLSQARRVYTVSSPLLMNIRLKSRHVRPFPTFKETRSTPSSTQTRIRHAQRIQQDSNFFNEISVTKKKSRGRDPMVQLVEAKVVSP
ncbi:Uncharacterized protein Rs2_26945 [Raphanus sativus]|nr:Uncharacterized protein Rs2_26945 [Raphanus sativus]